MEENQKLTPYLIHKNYIDECEKMLLNDDIKQQEEWVDLAFSIYDDSNQMPDLWKNFREGTDPKTIAFNLRLIKGKIEMLLSQMLITNERATLGAPNIHISQNQHQSQVQAQDLEIEFDNLILSYEDDVDVFAKIREAKEIALSNEPKGKRWEKLKGILIWIADKGVEVGTALLPLILKSLG